MLTVWDQSRVNIFQLKVKRNVEGLQALSIDETKVHGEFHDEDCKCFQFDHFAINFTEFECNRRLQCGL